MSRFNLRKDLALSGLFSKNKKSSSSVDDEAKAKKATAEELLVCKKIPKKPNSEPRKSNEFVHPIYKNGVSPRLKPMTAKSVLPHMVNRVTPVHAYSAAETDVANLGVTPAKAMLTKDSHNDDNQIVPQAMLNTAGAAAISDKSALLDLHKTSIPKVDFGIGAKVHRRSVLKHSAARGLITGLYLIAFVAALAAAAGIFINYKFTNRALPFSYIGDVSVGGLNEAQIKEALDEKLKTMQITFVDGGLERQVPISQFGAKVDTAAAAYKATHTPFNPFAYLNKRQFEVDASINERQVTGYIETVVNRGKTNSDDAQLIIEKKKLKIFPETQGFRSNVQFINDRIKNSLISVKAPVVNVNVSTIKPNVYATDLEDDLARANSMLNTNVALQYNGTTIKPTLDDKMSWLQVNSVPGATNVQVSFSRTLVRQYVVTQANKFQGWSGVAATDAKDAVATTQKGTVIDNIDEATDGIINSLTNTKPYTQKLSGKIGTYNKLISAKQ